MHSKLQNLEENFPDFHHFQRQRQRVTVTVISIGLCFSLTQGPSAFMALYELFSEYELGHTFYAIFSITNSLVVTGKTINFILFCLSSEHFRQKCFKAIYRKFPKVGQLFLGGKQKLIKTYLAITEQFWKTFS